MERQQDVIAAERDRKAEQTQKDKAQADPKGKGRAVETESWDSDADSDDATKPSTSPYARYTMGKSRKDRVYIYDWLAVHAGDPAIQVRPWLTVLTVHAN